MLQDLLYIEICRLIWGQRQRVNEPLDVDLKKSARYWDREQLIISRNSQERCWVFRCGIGWNGLIFYSHFHAESCEDVALCGIGCEVCHQVLRNMDFCERPVDVWLFGVTRCQWIFYNH
jgi:hypothetical protein